ncbi:hypothetical protein G7Y89_g2348 [Cudoniella acicularis]|uniref:Uncharacterized protein n=1 Tax=Cudoniella acicularis TaxID=354080 RepID=A0A8H4RTI6_9HELO|nr:hypothetical protein G7Y89_g2348 [Cudoniella acicularis]
MAESDFTPYQQPSLPTISILAFPLPYLESRTSLSPLTLPFLSRIFLDFNHQWRHIFRWIYADSTFRKLSYAILQIALLDFRIVEDASRWNHKSLWGAYVNAHQLPPWQACEDSFFRVGNTFVVLDQGLQRAMAIVEQHAKDNITHPSDEQQPTKYFLLSVRHVMLCRAGKGGVLSYTQPTPFLNGVDAPSPEAIKITLEGLSPPYPHKITKLHQVPIEIQDRILEHASERSGISTARVSSRFGLAVFLVEGK